MMKYLYESSSPASLENFGAKALNLAKLDQSFKIPKWIVLSNTFDIQNSAQELENYLKTHFVETKLFAVRSSAFEEDSQEYSYAGLFESYLNIAVDDVAEYVQKVFDSAVSSRVQSYVTTHKIPLPQKPCVIIQAMLAPSSAGVAFSSDPITADREISIVSSVEGLGDKLVDGSCNADTFYVKEKQIVSTTLSTEKASLSDEEVLQVSALSKKAEAFFEHPQDIEWAFEKGILHLLQSRAISTIKPTIKGEKRLWDNSNIVESYSGVTTPLTYSFARYVYEEVYIEFCKVLSVPSSRVHENRNAFRTLLGLINGRIYYNLISWNQILSLLPGFKFNRQFMEQMMGVKEGLPQEIIEKLEASSKGSKYLDALGLVNTLLSLIYQQIRIKTTIKDFYARLKKALIPNSALKEKDIDALRVHYRNLESQLLNRWDAPLINDFLAMIYFGLLGKLCYKWLDADEYLQNDLLIDSAEIISAQPAKRIVKMAAIVAELGEEAIEILGTKGTSEIEAFVQKHPALDDSIKAYLELFGDRTLEELKLESFTLEDDATTLYRAIAAMALRPSSEPNFNEQKALARKRVDEKLSHSKIKLYVMNFVIHQAKERVSSRENLRFERTKLFGHIRRIFLSIGEQFAQHHILNTSRDIFYLEVNEIFGYIEGTSSTTDLKALVQLRQKEFARFKEAEISERFHTYGVVNFNNSFQKTEIKESSSELAEDALKGFGCCRGIVKAKVRVILEPQDALIKEGEILVARQTDPGWIMLFPASAGILVERGSMLSHSAIVAREMNIPAIVGIDHLLEKLQTGDEVEMNGATGEIKILTQNGNDV